MAKGKYEEWLTAEGLLQLEAWARNGLTDEQIASNIGITRTTLYEWKKLYPDISDALKRGKEVVDIQVENALLKRALGYQFTEVTRERVYNESTQKHKFEITKKVVKEVQPDTTAQIFWLKNRKPAEWRDRKEIDANIRRNDPFEGLTREQLLKIAGEEDV
ncbi:MAG: transposase [Sporomusa sp.]|nr:transposase [Sporomusa sp.]